MGFSKVQSQDRVLNQIQNNIQDALTPLFNNPVIGAGGNIVTQTLAVGSNTVNHGLGRIQQGWVPVDQNAVANFYRTGSFGPSSMIIVSSAIVTASFYCF